jgi:hypothetical protein
MIPSPWLMLFHQPQIYATLSNCTPTWPQPYSYVSSWKVNPYPDVRLLLPFAA